MENVRLGLMPPWTEYINKLQALFDGDPEIAFNNDYDSSSPSVVIATYNPDKAAALMQLLPEEKVFGNNTLKIGIDCDKISNRAFTNPKELFETVFYKNPALAYVVNTDGYWFIPLTYVVFANRVVQFYNDNLNDPHGVVSTLYQEIAKEVFADARFNFSVAYCTALEDEETAKKKLTASSGGWNVNIEVGKMPQKVATAFSKLGDLVGASYTPIAYLGSQVVNGINHAVLAEQTVLTGKDTKNIVVIIFNEKAGDANDPTVVNIERIIEGTSGVGGTSIDVKLDIPDDEMALFNKALSGFVGSNVESKALLATHVSNGVDYVFLAEISSVSPDATKKAAIVVVNGMTNAVYFTDILSKPNLGYAFSW